MKKQGRFNEGSSLGIFALHHQQRGPYPQWDWDRLYNMYFPFVVHHSPSPTTKFPPPPPPPTTREN